jgi:hypothetical protein
MLVRSMREDAVDRIYEAAFVPEAWPDAFKRIASLSGAASSAFVVYEGDEHRVSNRPAVGACATRVHDERRVAAEHAREHLIRL